VGTEDELQKELGYLAREIAEELRDSPILDGKVLNKDEILQILKEICDVVPSRTTGKASPTPKVIRRTPDGRSTSTKLGNLLVNYDNILKETPDNLLDALVLASPVGWMIKTLVAVRLAGRLYEKAQISLREEHDVVAMVLFFLGSFRPLVTPRAITEEIRRLHSKRSSLPLMSEDEVVSSLEELQKLRCARENAGNWVLVESYEFTLL